MPNLKVKNVSPSLRRNNVLPSVRISSAIITGPRQQIIGSGYSVGLLLALTYGVANILTVSSSDLTRPHIRITNA